MVTIINMCFMVVSVTVTSEKAIQFNDPIMPLI